MQWFLLAGLLCGLTCSVGAKDVVRYEDFGAVGDGETDDLEAIVKAHAHANEHDLPVRANDDATYYLGGRDLTAIIQTDTDFGKAKFVIDDRDLENRRANIFEVRSTRPAIKLEAVDSLKPGQTKLAFQPKQDCLVVVRNANVKQHIRRGLNQNAGHPQSEVFVLRKDGSIDPATPIVWQYDEITEITAHPIDERTLTVSGGHFTTIANQVEAKYSYHARGLSVRRSNVVVKDFEHHVTDEGESGAPYGGFINLGRCSGVILRDAILTGRKTYRTIGAAGRPVDMGSYDLHISHCANIEIVNVTQTNDINDRSRWGIMASNDSKNLHYDGCKLSRFDAHRSMFGGSIRNSTIGSAGINLIGGGTFTIENTTVHGRRLIGLRTDYGSTWSGKLVLKNATLEPGKLGGGTLALIHGRNDGRHDFGYPCFMPQQVIVDGLTIRDGQHAGDYRGPALFADLDARGGADASAPFRYAVPREVEIRGVTTESGKELRISDDTKLFGDVKVTRE